MNRRAKWPGADKHTRNVVQREVRKVPVPWGWPGHTATNADGREWQLSEAMRSFTDHLVKQKELANGTSLNPRSSRSIRALLEDRYAPMNRDSMRPIKYKTVKAPLLRDPDAPVDQMDSFGTRGLKPSLSKLQYQARMKANFEKMSKKRRVKSLDIKDIKQPWGW